MRTSSHEVAWVATLLEDLPEVDVLRLSVDSDLLDVGPENRQRLVVVNLDIHAGGWTDAILLAKALRLHETNGRRTESYYGVSVWRTWSGWAAEASHEIPVRVEVTAAELEADFPNLFIAQVVA